MLILFIQNVMTTGTVITIRRAASKDPAYPNEYPTIQFTDGNGYTVQFESAYKPDGCCTVGSTVPVRYDPSTSHNAKIDEPYNWLFPLGGYMLVAVFVLFMALQMRRIKWDAHV